MWSGYHLHAVVGQSLSHRLHGPWHLRCTAAKHRWRGQLDDDYAGTTLRLDGYLRWGGRSRGSADPRGDPAYDHPNGCRADTILHCQATPRATHRGDDEWRGC